MLRVILCAFLAASLPIILTSTSRAAEAVSVNAYLGSPSGTEGFYYSGTRSYCIYLRKISLSDDGYLRWNFSNRGCTSTKIHNVITFPSNGLRGVTGIKNKADVINQGQELTLITTPEVLAIEFTLDAATGKTGKYGVTAHSEINMLNEIASLGDWTANFNASESALVEKKANDRTPPEIQILSPLPSTGQFARVDTYTSYVRGKASDEQGVMNILVNGRKVSVKEDGTFASKVKLAIGRNDILVQAEDVNANVSEKTITIIRDEFISEQTMADVDLPPKTRMNNPDALGVVIGVESYQYVPDATYAYNDAEVFREYLAETMGMKRQRIKLATNTKATQAEFSKLLGPNGWLARNVVKGKSDIVVYFSGHGIASPDAKSSGLLPFDVDPNYSIGLPINQLYQDLASMGARSVTVFLDACFTGQTRNEEMLIANSRPIVIRPDATTIPPNVAVISAASGSQISGAIEEKEHGIFTYYVLKGMGGDADANKDGAIKLSELDGYVSANVRERSAADGREQVPEFVGDGSAVIVRLQ